MGIFNSFFTNFSPITSCFTGGSLLIFPLYLFAIVALPNIGFIDTIRLMVKNRNAASFNFATCLILISSNGIKILYYIFRQYEINTFLHVISQFSIAIIMIYLKYYYMKKPKRSSKKKTVNSNSTSYQTGIANIFRYLFITRMTTFKDFLISFSIYFIIFLITFIISYLPDKESTLSFFGNIANLLELMIVIPTFIRVIVYKDVKNISPILIVQFAFGDIVKLVIFLLSDVSGWMIFGVCIQIVVNMTLLTVFCQYRLCPEEIQPKKKARKELTPHFEGIKTRKVSDGLSDEECLIEKRNIKLDYSNEDHFD